MVRKHSKTGKRRCVQCGVLRPRAEFPVQSDKPDGISYICKQCAKSRRLAFFYRRQFGLSLDEAHAILDKAVHGHCEVCGKQETATRHGVTRRLTLDHDHATGKVRGLLCSKCNLALGLLDDDPDRLRSMIRYLKRHRQGGHDE